MSQIPVALQLYTVRDQTAKDFAGTVRKVAEMGYAGVEFAGTGDLSVTQMSDLLEETGLKPAGAHVGLGLMQEDLEYHLNYQKSIGNGYIGVPALPGDMRNPAGFHEVAKFMNEAGAQAKDAGLQLYYHNHAFEFDVIDGTRGMDILWAETDPDLVKFQCDVYWVAYAGENPSDLIDKHAGRYPLIHLKDMIGQGDGRTFAEVGEGVLAFDGIFEASEDQGAVWYIVEQDRCDRPTLQSAKISIDNLKKMGKA